ncbi:MAG: regulatory protein RecX [Aeromonadaceae bacterium]
MDSSTAMVTDDPEFKLAMARAVRLLTRREHSGQEIRKRLADEYSPRIIEAVVQACLQRDWLNEERMLASAIRARVAKGLGPVRIAHELRLKGLCRDAIQQALASEEYDWFALAREQARRKVPSPGALERSARARLLGFLQRRGFNSEQCRYACQPDET